MDNGDEEDHGVPVGLEGADVAALLAGDEADGAGRDAHVRDVVVVVGGGVEGDGALALRLDDAAKIDILPEVGA